MKKLTDFITLGIWLVAVALILGFVYIEASAPADSQEKQDQAYYDCVQHGGELIQCYKDSTFRK